MRLYEFQAKLIFRDHGIRIPKGLIAKTREEAVDAADRIGLPVAIKAQVLSGGRGLAGGIKIVNSRKDVPSVASLILETNVKSEKPLTLLIEEKVEIAKELYCAVTWDYPRKCPVLIASSSGGMDIEAIARDRPTEVVTLPIDPYLGYGQYIGRQLAARIGLQGKEVVTFSDIVNKLWNVFSQHDAELVEINPLGLLGNGDLVAVDAKLILDDKSLFRQNEIINQINVLPNAEKEGLAYRRLRAKELGIPTYIEMEGEIGVLSDGAGTGMLTLDLISDLGGKIRVYCEMGGEATPELMEKTLMTMAKAGNVRVVLVSLIGGLNRMDEMAEGIVRYMNHQKSRPQVVVRMAGTQEDEGMKILSENSVAHYNDLYEAVQATMNVKS
jgi:succinyl-CoA synthetase beta subunit